MTLWLRGILGTWVTWPYLSPWQAGLLAGRKGLRGSCWVQVAVPGPAFADQAHLRAPPGWAPQGRTCVWPLPGGVWLKNTPLAFAHLLSPRRISGERRCLPSAQGVCLVCSKCSKSIYETNKSRLKMTANWGKLFYRQTGPGKCPLKLTVQGRDLP